MNSREAILACIRQSTRARKPVIDGISRDYLITGALPAEGCVELLCERLMDYGCGVHRCSNGEISRSIGQILRERGKSALIAPPDVPREWFPKLLPDAANLSYRELDQVDGVITRCALAIAATGTIVLRHDEMSGRRAFTLIPDYHLCIVLEDQIVEQVPEGMRRMALFAPAPITTISGPSATSDIEMTRVKGVHGPRTLDVLIVK